MRCQRSRSLDHFLPQWCYSNNDKNLQRPFARYEPYFSISIGIRSYKMYIYDENALNNLKKDNQIILMICKNQI